MALNSTADRNTSEIFGTVMKWSIAKAISRATATVRVLTR